jgi:acetyltransferase-like isoleucine patch superfamily enzyme
MVKLSIIYSMLKNGIKFRFSKNISRKIFLGPNVQFFGINNIIIRENCTIGENSLFTINNRMNSDVQLTINSNVYIGRNNFISVGKSIYISDYCIFGNNCSFICSDHIFDNPLVSYASSGNSYNKRINIGVNCWLGHGVSVIGDVKIGHGSIIGAHTLVTKDIPPFSMVIGNPAKVIKTFNFERNKWEKEVSTNDSTYLDEQEYLKYIKANSQDAQLAHYSASSQLGHL